LYQQSLETDRELGNQVGIAGTLVQLGALAQDTGDYVEARRLYRQGLDISQELGPAGRAAVAGALQPIIQVRIQPHNGNAS
jgi:hypothetical protein